MEDNGGELAEIYQVNTMKLKWSAECFFYCSQGHEMAGHLPVNVAIFQAIFCTNNPAHEWILPPTCL